MSDTPRTDESEHFIDLDRGIVDAGLSRQLERELNAANAKIKRLEEYVEQLTNPKFTRDDLPKDALLQRIKRLEDAGDAMAKWLDRNTPVAVRFDWSAAKEAKQ